MTQPSMFPSYPEVPGFKRTDTSARSAQQVDAESLRRKVLYFLKWNGPHTADEIAFCMFTDKLSIRPRLSELRALGKVYDTKERRKNASGKAAIVWAVVR